MHLPLGLQYIFTNGACVAFAHALQRHPLGAGLPMVELRTRDPAKCTAGSGSEAYLHTLLRCGDGRTLDAEGVRSFEALCRAFGADPTLSSLVEAGEEDLDSSPIDADRIGELLTLCWETAAPAFDSSCVSAHWAKGRAEFDRWGGLAGDPNALLDRARRAVVARRRAAARER